MDSVTSKEKLPDWLRRWYALKGELRFREAADEIERLQRQVDALRRERDMSASVAGRALTELHEKVTSHEPPAAPVNYLLAKLCWHTCTCQNAKKPDVQHGVYCVYEQIRGDMPRASQPPAVTPKFKVGDAVIPTIAPHARGDIRVRAVEITYRISVDGAPMASPYAERELLARDAPTKGEQRTFKHRDRVVLIDPPSGCPADGWSVWHLPFSGGGTLYTLLHDDSSTICMPADGMRLASGE